ncbi:MAG: universal stress protein [Shewanella psychromarinicola]|jgi:universal stress protein A|uniref:Universal stress protein n=3 Tax=Shewanella psychromarinicola TaxID=2487742 RepID=A0A3N4F239_9GAMM|nr:MULTISPECIES: universal stress protein [Shewanella]AZG37228.1 universal stress protein [Shewanella psychromarinicola]MCL1081742.1 universal stress protein [Shewanella psychromarinicola]PKG78444.1 universal stress protein [Shewanella sp. Actino-trap-3]RPA35084.1 universal stress protein [Shewanella psychromarinicola]|tara:strand:- start:43668 stop:44099 length:432 start_codon:yes stop_codon:yes gene_type:complete
MRTRNILWPTDFSDTSSHALSYAIEMANLYKVGIRIVHVVDQPFGDENYMILAVTPEELAKTMEAAAAKKMHDLLGQLNTDLKIETVIRRGDAIAEILAEANSGDIGMVVIASHGRSGLSHFLNDNVAETIANKATCPVLVVK